MFQDYHYILVVDDHAGVRRVMFEFLSNEGFEVETAANGIEAIQKATTRAPALILLDLRMPGISGLETMIRLQKILPNVPVVIVTAYSEQDVLKTAVEAGLVQYQLRKPFDLEELRSLINWIISERVALVNQQ